MLCFGGGWGEIVPLVLVNLHQYWGQRLTTPARSGQDMGTGQVLTPPETQSLWTRAAIPIPTTQDLGKRGMESEPRPPEHGQESRACQGEGKEPGEILEVPLSPAKAPCPLPGGSANYPPSLTGQTQNQGTLSLPTSQQDTKAVKTPSFVARKKNTLSI